MCPFLPNSSLYSATPEIFESGGQSSYDKPFDGVRILKNNDLMVAIQACPELKAFVNRIISLCDESQVIG